MHDGISIQLARRVQRFKETTGLTSRQVGKLTGISEQSLCDFLAGRKGLSANSMVHLLNLVNASKTQIEKKLAAHTAPARLAHMQVQGMRLAVDDGGGWVPAEGEDSDPNDSTDITNTWKVGGQPVDDDLLNVLRQIDAIHAQARSAISDFITKAQAKPNASGSTESPRLVRSNEQSKTAGPRPDAFSLQKRLEFERQRAEEELALQKQIKAERKQALNARIQLSELKKQTVFD